MMELRPTVFGTVSLDDTEIVNNTSRLAGTDSEALAVANRANEAHYGMSAEDIIREYPDPDREDIRQSLQYASALANEEIGFFKNPAA
jgi:Protein of unknown function (DUF433)